MTRYVVDASVAVEYLLRTPRGLSVADIIESASLAAPELMDVEVLSTQRRGESLQWLGSRSLAGCDVCTVRRGRDVRAAGASGWPGDSFVLRED